MLLTSCSNHKSIHSSVRQRWSAVRLHSWCSFLATDEWSSTQPDQIWSNSVHIHPWSWQSWCRHFRRCVECYHSTCIEHSKPWSHSRPEALIWPTREHYLQIMLPPCTSGHCGISAIHCLMKLSRPSLAVWLVPASITVMLSSLECRNRISPNCNEYTKHIDMQRFAS